jgi:Concanavalin A-like lectin/glucanases superfamily
MPNSIVCPGCGKKVNAPEDAAGKAIRCPHCRQSIRIPGAERPAPSIANGIMPVRAPGRAGQRTASLDKRPVQDRSRRRVDEIEMDEDRPRRRQPAQSNSSLMWILAGVAGAAMVAMMGIGAILFVVLRGQAVEEVAVPVAVAEVVEVPVPVAKVPVAKVQAAKVPAAPVPAVAEANPAEADWIVAFRSKDASIWGKDVNNGPDHRAVRLNRIPSGIRYLRIQECVNNAFIIIPMSMDRLGKDSVQEGIGWNGTGRMEWRGRHLGVYSLAWDQLQKGDISFSTPAFFKGYKGWGFGHRIRNDDVQGYAWNGDAIPQTVFEIAVTTGELSTAEKGHLLGPNGQVPKAPPEVAKLDPDPAPADVKPTTAKSAVFVFDGKSRIVTPLERFAPVTLEAWFRPGRDSATRRRADRIQYLIGSDIPGQYGYGIGIRYDGNVPGGLQMETIRSFYDCNSPISASEWSHVAAVFAPTEVTIYLNGKITFKQSRDLEIIGGTTFAIGKSGPDATVPFYFTGEIREIRISNGTRYSDGFAPPPTFVKDATSALIYRASNTNGRKVIDLSGNGRDGELDGVVVSGEGEKVAAGPPVLASGSKEYEPKSKRFTIAMPTGVKNEQASKTFPLHIPPGVKLPSKSLRPTLAAEVATSQLADGTNFIAASIGMPAVLLREVPAERRLEVYRDVFLKAANGQIVSETEIGQGRFTGKEYFIDLPNGQMRMQLLMLGGAGCYAMVETSSIERLATRDVDEYFDSFKIKE